MFAAISAHDLVEPLLRADRSAMSSRSRLNNTRGPPSGRNQRILAPLSRAAEPRGNPGTRRSGLRNGRRRQAIDPVKLLIETVERMQSAHREFRIGAVDQDAKT